MIGLTEAADSILVERALDAVRDADMISCQKIQYNELSSYVTVVAFVQIFRETQVAELITKILAGENELTKPLVRGQKKIAAGNVRFMTKSCSPPNIGFFIGLIRIYLLSIKI